MITEIWNFLVAWFKGLLLETYYKLAREARYFIDVLLRKKETIIDIKTNSYEESAVFLTKYG